MRRAGGTDEASVLQTKARERGKGKEEAQVGLRNSGASKNAENAIRND